MHVLRGYAGLIFMVAASFACGGDGSMRSVPTATATAVPTGAGIPTATATPLPTPIQVDCSGCLLDVPCSVMFEGVEYPGFCGESVIINGKCLRPCVPRQDFCSGDACDGANDCVTVSISATVILGHCQHCRCVPVDCGPTEGAGGCCDFGGQRPCYPVRNGDDAWQCDHDGGTPRGCAGSVTCNSTTGLCEP